MKSNSFLSAVPWHRTTKIYPREKPRILILDDHAVVRRSIRNMLAARFGSLEFEEGNMVSNGIDLAADGRWDLVIVAPDLLDRKALDALAQLKRISTGQPVLILTFRAKLADAMDSAEAGTVCYLNYAHDKRSERRPCSVDVSHS